MSMKRVLTSMICGNAPTAYGRLGDVRPGTSEFGVADARGRAP
jgi:hypothetical protein